MNKQGDKELFIPNSIQKSILANNNPRKIILKARQFGVSTMCLLRQLDKTLFTNNMTTCILAHEQDGIKKLFRIVAGAYKFMPDEFKPAIDRGGGSKYEMYFPERNSRIYCDLESRGDTIQDLHISEAAFISDVGRMRSTIQAVPIGNPVTIETTPNGLANHFYEEWINHNQAYEKLFFPWFLHEEYKINQRIGELTQEEKDFTQKAFELFKIKITPAQIAFRRLKQNELKELFQQEYPEDDITCFLTTGNSPFNLQKLKAQVSNIKEPIEIKDGIRIYEKFEMKNTYVIGADPAEGIDGDSSAAIVLNAKTYTICAALHGYYRPFEFAHKLNALGKLYGRSYMPMLSVERNNHGHAVLQELSEHIRYNNLYAHEDMKLGYPTTRLTRPDLFYTFVEAVESQDLKIVDNTLFQECLTLVNNQGKIEAVSGKHDDLIVAAALGIQLCIKQKSLDVYNNIGSKIR